MAMILWHGCWTLGSVQLEILRSHMPFAVQYMSPVEVKTNISHAFGPCCSSLGGMLASCQENCLKATPSSTFAKSFQGRALLYIAQAVLLYTAHKSQRAALTTLV